MGAIATQNAELVRRGYEAFNAADIPTLTALFHEDASWHTPGRAIGGDYVGRDATFGQFGRYGDETQGTFRAELIDLTESEGGLVVGVHRNIGERNGKRLARPLLHRLRVQGRSAG